MFAASETHGSHNVGCGEPSTGDLHICGACKAHFSHIDEFVIHKREGCGPKSLPESDQSNIINDSILDLQTQCQPTCQSPVLKSPVCTEEQVVQSPDIITSHVSSVDTSRSSHLENQGTLTTHSSASASLVSSAPTSNSPVTTAKSSVNKRFKCHYEGCSYSTAYPKDLKRHLRVHTGERPFECKICGKKFNRSDKLKIHERHHSGIKPYKCKECDYATGDSSSLKKHSRIHSNERPFRCQICQYASRNSSQLVVHLRAHTGDAPFQCPMCPNKFKINSDLKRHLRLHTGEKPYSCSFCDYKCSIKGNLTTHVRLNHSTDNLRKCIHCDFSSPSRKTLRQHEKGHVLKSVKCPHPQCEYSCKSRALLLNHARTHSDERPFKCKHCPYTSRQPGNVRTHLKKRHPEKMTGKHRKVGSKKPVANGTAPPEATNNGTNAASEPNESQVRIKIPTRTKFRNSRNRPMCIPAFKCHLCTSAFVREDSLRSHLRQHQRLQPVTQSVFIVDPAAVSNPTSTQTVDSELVSDSTVTDPSVEETGDISVQQVDTSLTSLQTPCEGLAEQPESENDICVLNVYPQPLLTSDVDPAPDQVIEQALRQSGVLCLPPGTLDCGTTLNLIQNEAGTIELREEPSPTSSFCMTNDDGGNAQAILNAFASLGATSDSGLSTIQASVSPTIDVSDAKTVLMNATNIEIPLSALASGLGPSTQLIYQMQPNIRLVPYRSPATVQYVLKTTPTGCTQILFNSATSETGEPLQMQDLSILQSHVDASPGHQTDTNFGQQLLNYVLNNGAENEPATPTAVSSVGNTVSRLLLVSTTPVQATGPTALDPLAPPTTPTTTILP